MRNGIKDSNGDLRKPKVIRLGRGEAINASVRDLTLEELVERELNKEGKEKLEVDKSNRENHTKVLAERNEVRKKLQDPNLTGEEIANLQTELREISKRKNELGRQLDAQRERIAVTFRNREINRRNIQSSLLAGSEIICSTLSGSAHSVLSNLGIKFETVIIDEAAQCIELSAIIPLRYGCKKCIMVGDPNQLPPTVLSQAAASYSYEQSLFVRMQQNHPNSVYLLNTQYRMHPMISSFPSKEFYHSQLIDGPNMAKITEKKWHKLPHLGPYRFFDVVSKHQQSTKSKSLFNTAESELALKIVERVIRTYPDDNWVGKIGIISPYKEQIRSLKNLFKRKYNEAILNEIDFNTVDGFQGQEKEIIILSCVRANDGEGSVGFLSDVRRMNVGLTRARSSLWILGSSVSLKNNRVWNRLIEDTMDRGLYTKATSGFLDRPPVIIAPTKANNRNSNIESTTKDQSYNPSSTHGTSLKELKTSDLTQPITKPVIASSNLESKSQPPLEEPSSLPVKANNDSSKDPVIPKFHIKDFNSLARPKIKKAVPPTINNPVYDNKYHKHPGGINKPKPNTKNLIFDINKSRAVDNQKGEGKLKRPTSYRPPTSNSNSIPTGPRNMSFNSYMANNKNKGANDNRHLNINRKVDFHQQSGSKTYNNESKISTKPQSSTGNLNNDIGNDNKNNNRIQNQNHDNVNNAANNNNKKKKNNYNPNNNAANNNNNNKNNNNNNANANNNDSNMNNNNNANANNSNNNYVNRRNNNNSNKKKNNNDSSNHYYRNNSYDDYYTSYDGYYTSNDDYSENKYQRNTHMDSYRSNPLGPRRSNGRKRNNQNRSNRKQDNRNNVQNRENSYNQDNNYNGYNDRDNRNYTVTRDNSNQRDNGNYKPSYNQNSNSAPKINHLHE